VAKPFWQHTVGNKLFAFRLDCKKKNLPFLRSARKRGWQDDINKLQAKQGKQAKRGGFFSR